jgi:hypothetical protein
MCEINLSLKLRRRQAQVFSCLKRFIVVVAGRRWGKTTLAMWWLIVNAFSGDDRLCYYVASLSHCRIWGQGQGAYFGMK